MVLQSDGETERRTHGWMDEWMDKWMVLQSDGETEGYIDGWEDGRNSSHPFYSHEHADHVNTQQRVK